MGFQLANKEFLIILLCIFFLIYGFLQLEKKRKKIDKIFLKKGLSFLPFNKIKFFLEMLCLVFLVLGLARLQGNPERITSSQTGRDVVFLLDLSKSMLAQDVRPNRLVRAKELIISILRELKGDRVGLVVFAGNSAIKSPLTLDYNYFQKILRMTWVNDLAQGGTQLEQAIRVVVDRVLHSDDTLYQDVILLTDGESKEDAPLEAAKLAAEKGVSIYTVGIGNPNGVRLVDNRGKAIKFQGESVVSRLDEETLKEIARITRSAYFPVHTKQADLGAFYKRFIRGKSKRLVEDTETILWQEYYQYFLFLALCCLVLWNFLQTKKTHS
jgi:Ca-activated chloride channel family protein